MQQSGAPQSVTAGSTFTVTLLWQALGTPATEESGGGFFGSLGEMFGGSTGPRGGKREGIIEAAAKSATRGMAGTVGREVGKQILRGVLGSILGGGSRRR